MAFFTTNSNKYLENTLIFKKSNNTKHQQSENQNKNEIEIYYNNSPPINNDSIISDFNLDSLSKNRNIQDEDESFNFMRFNQRGIPSINNDSIISDFNFDSLSNNRNIIQDENESFNNNPEENNRSKFLSRKRKETHQNNFFVFTPQSNNDNDVKELINKTLNDLENSKIKIYPEMEELDHPKKQHRKKKNIFTRKFNSDNIIKKIKRRFLKSLKKSSNNKLKSIRSIKLFKNLPQEFVCNITKDFNCSFFDKTYKEILSKNFNCVGNGKNSSLKQIEHNKSVLKYLEDNKKINDLNFLNMTYTELFNEYLESKEFENEINNLKEKEKEKLSYIKNYIIRAYNFFNFFIKINI